jgi:hypothetical protein
MDQTDRASALAFTLILAILAAGAEVLTNSRGEPYYPGTPSYVPLIDDCIVAGGTRAKCIEALPADELKKLEAAEAERGAMLREQMKVRE